MSFVGVVPTPFPMPEEIIDRITDTGALRYAIQVSHHDDYEIADAIGISHGYMSKVLKGTAGLYGRRLVKFMQATNSIAPLQWLAREMGCEVVIRNRVEQERQALRRRLAELEQAA